MTPSEQRNTKLANKLIKQLQRRHFDVFFCKSSSEAVEKINSIINSGSTVTWGGSMTIRDTGITESLHQRSDITVLDRDLATTNDEKLSIYRKAFEADYYLSSVNAISEDGVIINIDGNGNRVAAITWGPKHVIFVVGMNKIAQDVDAAMKRARSTAAPINAARFDINTPCQVDGCCHNCNSPQSICNYIHVLRNSHPEKRHIVILVNENLGY
jgi:L-lactate utilization protein LutB